ncbi:hypothetical protein VST7929_02767 [Vibrio stylophorae]|uniref:Uncharacterized protein n=1 Tax=Vibrio stylophorae TaxID=659351 RepID=A0ABN8DY89_9VIBR|nr:hypothetical protein [Vibrio stylophorae]CAH0535106.1 hypothetical protein VST7929_02767 [Vibrio stylophorae]
MRPFQVLLMALLSIPLFACSPTSKPENTLQVRQDFNQRYYAQLGLLAIPHSLGLTGWVDADDEQLAFISEIDASFSRHAKANDDKPTLRLKSNWLAIYEDRTGIDNSLDSDFSSGAPKRLFDALTYPIHVTQESQGLDFSTDAKAKWQNIKLMPKGLLNQLPILPPAIELKVGATLTQTDANELLVEYQVVWMQGDTIRLAVKAGEVGYRHFQGWVEYSVKSGELKRMSLLISWLQPVGQGKYPVRGILLVGPKPMAEPYDLASHPIDEHPFSLPEQFWPIESMSEHNKNGTAADQFKAELKLVDANQRIYGLQLRAPKGMPFVWILAKHLKAYDAKGQQIDQPISYISRGELNDEVWHQAIMMPRTSKLAASVRADMIIKDQYSQQQVTVPIENGQFHYQNPWVSFDGQKLADGRWKVTMYGITSENRFEQGLVLDKKQIKEVSYRWNGWPEDRLPYYGNGLGQLMMSHFSYSYWLTLNQPLGDHITLYWGENKPRTIPMTFRVSASEQALEEGHQAQN